MGAGRRNEILNIEDIGDEDGQGQGERGGMDRIHRKLKNTLDRNTGTYNSVPGGNGGIGGLTRQNTDGAKMNRVSRMEK